MQQIFKLSLILGVSILFTSCISHKKFNYAHINSPKDLEGVYVNGEQYPPEIIKVDYLNDKRLEVSSLVNSEWSEPILYKGKFDKKRNTFERWVHRKILPFILFYKHEFEKERIGMDDSGNLIINIAHNRAGMLLPIGANGDSYSRIKTYKSLKDQILIPTKSNEKWGYEDFLSKDMIISYTYDSACFFQDSLARVMIDSKWGLIDQSGNIVTTPKYDEIKPLEYGSMEIKKDNKWGFLNSSGYESIPCIYDEISYPFSYLNGLKKVVLNGKLGLINNNYQQVVPCEFDKIDKDWYNKNLFIIEKSKLKGLANADGIICPPLFKKVEIISENKYNDILAIVYQPDNKAYYIDSEGYLYLPKKLNFIKKFTSDLGSVGAPDYDTKFHYTELKDN